MRTIDRLGEILPSIRPHSSARPEQAARNGQVARSNRAGGFVGIWCSSPSADDAGSQTYSTLNAGYIPCGRKSFCGRMAEWLG